MTYALDTNVIIRLLRNDSAVATRFDNAVNNDASIVIPPYANFEILRGFCYRSAPSKERSYRELCVRYPVLEMTADVWNRAATLYGELRRAGYTVGDADLLIAAFCIIGGYTLVTNNTKDFEHIEGLQMADWTKE